MSHTQTPLEPHHGAPNQTITRILGLSVVVLLLLGWFIWRKRSGSYRKCPNDDLEF